MLKVCFITPNLFPVPNVKGGAIEALVTNMVRCQEKYKKIDMTVVSIYDKDAISESKKFLNTNFIYVKRNLRYYMTGIFYNIINKVFKKKLNTYNHIVLSKIKKMDFDYVIAEGGHYESYIEFLKYFDRSKLILHLHHQGSSNSIIDKAFSKLIGVSKFVSDDFKKSTKCIDVTYLNNGIELDKFDKECSKKELKELKEKYNIKDDDFVIIYCGRLIQVKGVLELIKAVKNVNNDNIKLMILGSSSFLNGKEDEYTKKLKEEITGHEDKVFFTGYIHNSEIYKYYALASISCLPSIWEDAAPLTCIEAMMCKKVVLATRSGGAPEYLQKDTSLIIEKDKNLVKNLENGIKELYSKKDKLEELGLKAYKHAKKFNSVNYYNDFIDILNKFKEGDYNEK